MPCGDVLSDGGEGWILAGAFAYITPEMMEQVEVVAKSEVLPLLKDTTNA